MTERFVKISSMQCANGNSFTVLGFFDRLGLLSIKE